MNISGGLCPILLPPIVALIISKPWLGPSLLLTLPSLSFEAQTQTRLMGNLAGQVFGLPTYGVIQVSSHCITNYHKTQWLKMTTTYYHLRVCKLVGIFLSMLG